MCCKVQKEEQLKLTSTLIDKQKLKFLSFYLALRCPSVIALIFIKMPNFLVDSYAWQCLPNKKTIRRQLGNLQRGRRYIFDRKNEIIHGVSPSVKWVAPLLREFPKPNSEMQEGCLPPEPPPPSCAPPNKTRRCAVRQNIQF